MLKPRGGVDWARHTGAPSTQAPSPQDLLFHSYHYPQLTRPSSSVAYFSEHILPFSCLQVVLVVAVDVEAVALKVVEEEVLKAVGIVVVEGSVEVKGLPMAMVMAVAVVAPHLSIEVEFPEVFATFFGLMVPVTASSTARSSTSKNPRRRRLPRYPPQRSKINCQIFSLAKD